MTSSATAGRTSTAEDAGPQHDNQTKGNHDERTSEGYCFRRWPRCRWRRAALAEDGTIKIGIPVGLSRRQQRGGAVGRAVGRARRRGDQRGRRHPRPEARARGRRRRLRRRRRAEGLRFADLPEEGQRADLDGDERRAQRRPADRRRGRRPVHLHLVLRGAFVQPVHVRQRLGARAAGGADRRPLHEEARAPRPSS